MGYYTEYLNKKLGFQSLEKERKEQLLKISELRGNRDILVYAADLTKSNNTIDYTDILPVQDQLANLNNVINGIDVIIETPGGYAEAAEDIISMIRCKYSNVGIIVPGWAKSAGTILAMAGDEILMGTGSALGPIDAQIPQANGKRYSAHAFLEGFNKIKEEAAQTGKLNSAYIPILQNVSPGEIQNAENAQSFSERLVAEWLEHFKFKNWKARRTSGTPVTDAERKKRAKEIAAKLSDQGRWFTHGRSIRIRELEEEINIQITDYSKNAELNEAITRYYTLLRMTFETNMYKLFETPTSQIYRFNGAQKVPNPPKNNVLNNSKHIHCKTQCSKCKSAIFIQANFEPGQPIKPRFLPFPENNSVKCPNCGTDMNVANMKLQIEAQTGKKIVHT